MKIILFIMSVALIFALGITEALAQTNPAVFTDTVVKIKEDDDGKLIVLKNTTQVLYLKYTTTNFDSVLSTLNNSLTFSSTVKISTDGKLNVLKAE
ncbi:MAG: hypothetical protein JNL11_15235 [Bdellovibrionaceae bacterium]|nr:hypothetical protein [Pseudobdellovibrionaceae bacterium]